MSTPYFRTNERPISNSADETLLDQCLIEIAVDQKLGTWRVLAPEVPTSPLKPESLCSLKG